LIENTCRILLIKIVNVNLSVSYMLYSFYAFLPANPNSVAAHQPYNPANPLILGILIQTSFHMHEAVQIDNPARLYVRALHLAAAVRLQPELPAPEHEELTRLQRLAQAQVQF
jgi:hypothetical protein